MRKYKVNVNGSEYEVCVELISDDGKAVAVPASPKEARVSAAAPSGAKNVTAPMTGTINAVNVKPGDIVKKGQTIMILEAMKMENEIPATEDGKVVSVAVAKGASVEAGALLCTIE